MTIDQAFAVEMTAYTRARMGGDRAAAWTALERGHILSQRRIGLHFKSHAMMFGYAVHLSDYREAAGQLFRLALVPLGHVTQRLPAGNIGRARMSAFAPMPVPPDIAAIIAADSQAR